MTPKHRSGEDILESNYESMNATGKRLTIDLPSRTRGPVKKSLFRRLLPVMIIATAGIVGFLIPAMQRSESSASDDYANSLPQQEERVPEVKYENKKFATVISNDLGYLNVRAEALATSTKLGTISIGDKLEVLAESTGWVKVKLATALQGQTEGWVSAEYVAVATEQTKVE